MIRRLVFSLLFVSTSGLAQQSWEDFTGEERAFFYRIARTTDILNAGIFHLFEFTDSIPWINDTLADWKFVEKQIIQDSDKLIYHIEEVPHLSNGLIGDLATHYALWELDKVLHFRKSTDQKDEYLKPKLAEFEKYVVKRVPASAIDRKADGSYDLRYALPTYFSPSLSCHDRMAAMKNSGYVQLDQMLCINAIYDAMEEYVAQRSLEVFYMLGGIFDQSQHNYFSAAGDGGSYGDLEAGYKPTPQNSALPDNSGLFSFEILEEEVKPKAVNEKPTGLKVLKVEDVVIREFKTNDELSTVLHFDVYNWHKERQTTIVIQKGGKSYILYGNNDNRLLSPDSTYGEGTTYRRLIWELENIHIADLREKLYGKRGYEYWIKEFEKKIQKTLLKIKKTEYKLDMLRHKPQGAPKIKKKKWRKIDLTGSDQAGQGHPTDRLTRNQKKMNIEQNRLIFLEGQLEAERKELARLKKEMEEAYFILVAYENKLDIMQKNLGLLEMGHVVQNEFYTFADGATFNKRTQDFTFPANKDVESFQIYHICFGEKVFSETREENFVHIQQTLNSNREKYLMHRVHLSETDRTMSVSDSVHMMDLFMALAMEETELEVVPVAKGVMREGDEEYFRNGPTLPMPFSMYDGIMSGAVVFHAEFGATLKIYVEGWQGQKLPETFATDYPKFSKWQTKHSEISELEFLSGIKALSAGNRIIAEMKALVPKWIKDSAAQGRILAKLSKIKLSTALFEDGKIEAKVPLTK